VSVLVTLFGRFTEKEWLEGAAFGEPHKDVSKARAAKVPA
jgi:hypothetical protein